MAGDKKKVQKSHFSTMLWGFSHNITPEFYGLRTLGISSLLSSPKLIHQGAQCTMSTPVPPGHQEEPVPGVRDEDSLPGQHGFIHSCGLITALEPFWANLLLRLIQLGTACPHWPGAAPPGLILCLVLAKGCQAGWVQKTHAANFIWTQVSPRNSDDNNSAVHSLC